jgi:hypothetical protein
MRGCDNWCNAEAYEAWSNQAMLGLCTILEQDPAI